VNRWCTNRGALPANPAGSRSVRGGSLDIHMTGAIEEIKLFSKKHLVYPKESIVNYGNLDSETADLIRTTLYEMVETFNIRLRVIGTGNDIEDYSSTYASFFNISDKKTVAEKQDNLDLINAPEGSSVHAIAWNDAIFFKESNWINHGEKLNKDLEDRFKEGKSKHKKAEGIIYHEYGHVLHHTLTYVKKNNTLYSSTFGKLEDDLTMLIYIKIAGRNLNFPFEELLGSVIKRNRRNGTTENCFYEIFAELFACYFLDKNKNDEKPILPPDVWHKTDCFLKTVSDVMKYYEYKKYKNNE